VTPKAILFDLDDTLLDNRPFRAVLPSACEEIARAFEGLSAQELLAANQRVFSAYWAEVEMPWGLGKVDTTTFSTEVWRRALLACGVTDEGAPRLAFEVHSKLGLAVRRLFEDAIPILDALKDRFLIGVVTNGAADLQRDKLRTTELDSYFQAVAISGELGCVKPDAGIFESVLDRLAVEPGDAWHVGDSLSLDVAGANAMGMTSVWLNRSGRQRGSGDPHPAIEIQSLLDLVTHLKLIDRDVVVTTTS
jgi:putative hydrolase of the HAD superfamily